MRSVKNRCCRTGGKAKGRAATGSGPEIAAAQPKDAAAGQFMYQPWLTTSDWPVSAFVGKAAKR